MIHTSTIELSRPIAVPGGEISRLTLRLPAPITVRDAGELECLAAMTGIAVEVLADIDLEDAERIHDAANELAARAMAAGDLPRPELKLVR